MNSLNEFSFVVNTIRVLNASVLEKDLYLSTLRKEPE